MVGQLDTPFIVDYVDPIVGKVHKVEVGVVNKRTLLKSATDSWFMYYMILLGGVLNILAVYLFIGSK